MPIKCDETKIEKNINLNFNDNTKHKKIKL
jgi:hypothetical protein